MNDDVVGDDEFGRDLRAAVHRLDRAEFSDPALRDRAAARMREAYATRLAGSESTDPRADAELTTLLTDESHEPSRARWLSAAAAVIVVLGMAALVWSVRGDDPAPAVDEPTTTPVSTIVEASDIPRLLGAGTVTTDVLGPRLDLTSEEPLWLLRAERGVVQFGLGEVAANTNTLTIVRPGALDPSLGADDLESLLDELPGSQERSEVVANRTVLSWRLLDPSGTDLCSPTCRPLFVDPPSVALRADGIIDVTEIPLDSESSAVLISTVAMQDFGAGGGGAFTDVIRSMKIEDASPLPDAPVGPIVEIDR